MRAQRRTRRDAHAETHTEPRARRDARTDTCACSSTQNHGRHTRRATRTETRAQIHAKGDTPTETCARRRTQVTRTYTRARARRGVHAELWTQRCARTTHVHRDARTETRAQTHAHRSTCARPCEACGSSVATHVWLCGCARAHVHTVRQCKRRAQGIRSPPKTASFASQVITSTSRSHLRARHTPRGGAGGKPENGQGLETAIFLLKFNCERDDFRARLGGIAGR